MYLGWFCRLIRQRRWNTYTQKHHNSKHTSHTAPLADQKKTARTSLTSAARDVNSFHSRIRTHTALLQYHSKPNNGAQVVIDQFIASGEVKWGRVNGITLMLPHGYEGQGPEHSSARVERFMQLAADTNMQIVQPTTASQIFHVLRRQMLRNLRKPLIIFTPKSLLRNKDATSPLSEFTRGGFQTVIPEHHEAVNKKADKVKRVLVCSGKVYYDLAKKREEKGHDDVAILRIEQLYPFPHKAFAAELKKYPNATELVWCQDEPQNQGAWFFIQHNIHENMLDGQRLGYAGRAASASPAVGYSHLHQEQQKALVEAAFAKLKGFVLSK